MVLAQEISADRSSIVTEGAEEAPAALPSLPPPAAPALLGGAPVELVVLDLPQALAAAERTCAKLAELAQEKDMPMAQAAEAIGALQQLPPRAANSLSKFTDIVRALRMDMRQMSSGDLVRRVGKDSGLLAELRNQAGASIEMIPNQRVAFSADVLGTAENIDAGAMTAWVRGKLIFNQQSVAAIAGELQRYVPGRIVVIGEPLQQLQLTGVFELDDINALLRNIAALAGAELIRLPLLTLIR